MAAYDEVLRAARALPQAEQHRLARELAGPQAGAGRGPELPMTQFPNLAVPRPHSVAWVKAERGHAVLATETPLSDRDSPEGAAAIAGMWAGRAEASGAAGSREEEGS